MTQRFTNESVTPAAFQRDVYANKDRWVSYYHQIKLVKDVAKQGSVLEVGVGNQVVANYLKTFYQVKTVDIIESLKPDYVASVEDLSVLPDNSFDVVLCAEVLEHLPFDKLAKCLSELKRVSKDSIIISLPYWGYTFGWRWRLPMLGVKTLKFKISGLKKHQFNGQHYWEIGKQGFPLKKIKHAIKEAGLEVKKSFWDLDDPYHYYFVLEK